jgi:hypothetical protein
MPAEGGNPDAIDMPRHNGNAIRKTKKPDNKSVRQFSINPGKPVLGNTDWDISLIETLVRNKGQIIYLYQTANAMPHRDSHVTL